MALAIDLLIIGAASVSVSAFVYLVGAMIDVNRANDINSIVSTVSTMVMFVLFEGIIPWNRNGRTLGGGFTRMTMETEERSGMRRGIFYMARIVVLYCAVYGLGTSCSFYVLLLDMALIVFWCAGKRMPYDCI